MKIESHAIYEHAEHGTVVALGVHQVYESYDTSKMDGDVSKVVVRYTTDWDAYGPMPASTIVDPVDEFEAAANGPTDTVTFDS